MVIVEEDVVDDEAAGFGQGGGTVIDELLAFREVPIVQDVGEEDEVCAGGDGVGEHVGGDEVEAVGDAVLVGHFRGDLEDLRAIEDGGAEAGVLLQKGDGIEAGAAGDIDEVAGGGCVETIGEGGGDVLGAAGEGEGEEAGGLLGFHGGLEAVAEDEGGAGVGLFAGGPVGAEALDHFDDTGGVGGEADVAGDVEGGIGEEVVAGEVGEVEMVVGGGEEIHGAQGGEQDDGGTGGEGEFVSESFRRHGG